MHNPTLRNHTPRSLRFTTLLALGLCAAACAATDDTSAVDAPDADSPSTGAAGAGASSTKATQPAYPKASAEANATDDRYTLADPEEALLAIPSAMRPADLLDTLKAKLLVPDVKTGGRAYFTDIMTVDAGQDVTFCTYVDEITDKVMYLHNSLGSQTASGHHAILQYTTTPQEPGTRACAELDDLANQPGQILGGTGGEGSGGIVLPSNVVTEIPKGSQFVINHHWINTGDEAMRVQAEMITVPPDTDIDLVVARALTIVVTDFEVAPGSFGEASGECTLPNDTQVLSMIGHEHRWGTHVKAERMGSEHEVIFDHDYDPEMVSQPITTDFALEKPLKVSAGDKLRMTCQWNNTTNAALTFPTEMCVLFGWQIGADKDAICYGGAWL